MIKLQKIFDRYPDLTMRQREELCLRRLERFINKFPFTSMGMDINYVVGYLGIESRKSRNHRLRKLPVLE